MRGKGKCQLSFQVVKFKRVTTKKPSRIIEDWKLDCNKYTWWFMILAESLWISRSSWSANSFAFVAAADRPALEAALSFASDSGIPSAKQPVC